MMLQSFREFWPDVFAILRYFRQMGVVAGRVLLNTEVLVIMYMKKLVSGVS